MIKVTIHNFKHEKPTELYDIPVCRRRSILGNPYLLKSEADRDKVCNQYEDWFEEQLVTFRPELQRILKIGLHYGKLRLFCWCAPKRCHAETIKGWIEREVRRIQLANEGQNQESL